MVFPQFGWAVFGIPLGLAALVCGISGIRRAKEKGGRRLAVWGAALGVLGPIAGLVVSILLIEVFDVPCC